MPDPDAAPYREGFDPRYKGCRAECDGGQPLAGTHLSGRQEFTGTLIGRGAHTSYCVLFVEDKDEENRQRLAIMEETSDGFQIAEEDLRRRGPGDVLGHAQSGQAPLLFGELLADTRLVRLARQLAEKTLDEDPHLQRPALAAFRDEPVVAEKAQAMMQ